LAVGFQALKVRATASGDAVEKRRPEFLKKFGVDGDERNEGTHISRKSCGETFKKIWGWMGSRQIKN
jgi:hypothetical protein